MTTFQIVTLPLIALIVLAIVIQTARRRLVLRIGVAWIVLWSAAAISIADPELLVRAAHFLGIGRGADLVLYLSVIFSFSAFFITYMRFRRVDEQLTTIVRSIAIRDVIPTLSEASGEESGGRGSDRAR